MNRRQLLLRGTAAAALGGLGISNQARATTRPTKLVVVFVNGGWDVTMGIAPRLDDSFIEGPRVDELADVPEDVEELGVYGDLHVALNDCDVVRHGSKVYTKRPNARVFFDKWSSQCCAINGVWTGAVGHEPSTIRMCTGTQSGINPDLGAIVSHEFGANVPLGYVAIAGLPFVGPYAASSGQFGFNSQIKVLFNKAASFPPPTEVDSSYPLFLQSEADEAAVQAFLRERADNWSKIRGDNNLNSTKISDLYESYDRSASFSAMTSDFMDTLTLGRSPTLDRQAELAADFLSLNICKSVLIDSKGAWDTHSGNFSQHAFYNSLYGGLDTLMSSLESRGILDDTLVVVVSEMTRTPKINHNLGKDHWPHASVLLMGAGVRGQTSLGDYNELMESMKMSLETGEVSNSGDQLTYAEFFAGVIEHLDIDPEKYLPGITPFRGFVA